MTGALSPTVSGGVPAQVSSAELVHLTGMPFLQQLSLLPADSLASFLGAHPKTVSTLLASPPVPSEVSGWWNTLDTTAQTAALTSAPRLVGNLDGIPASARNAANRVWLDQSMDSLQARIASAPGRAIVDESERQIHMLGEVKSTLKEGSKSIPRSLLSVDPTGAGRASVVLGDLATADYVTYMVPGMFFTVDGQIHDWTDDAERVYKEQVTWLSRIAKDDPSEAGKSVAVVSWMGYETPNLTNVGALDLAYKGRDALADAIEGLQSVRSANEPYVTIIAHSYGSTAALMALTEYDFDVDALVVVGSPGSAAQSVDELNVRNRNMYVGAAAWDPVPNSSFFGSEPSAPEYGAKKLDVSGAVDPITGASLSESFGHNGYFDKGSSSVRNMALIGIDQDGLVMTGSASDSSITLADAK
ncbi:alpha/beta hydrolase [Glaciihabitans sp. dw_435]|uniref:alpha/beta hydrolase n=1 Tax=Glaciihabitans sp. dw_435 TaxID=2720081 RepID=UPI001BD54763|nr:alpha/beta hydrolase [Glaciihabitans sp. dw_435]